MQFYIDYKDNRFEDPFFRCTERTMFQAVLKTSPIIAKELMQAYMRNPQNAIPFVEYNQTVEDFSSLSGDDTRI